MSIVFQLLGAYLGYFICIIYPGLSVKVEVVSSLVDPCRPFEPCEHPRIRCTVFSSSKISKSKLNRHASILDRGRSVVWMCGTVGVMLVSRRDGRRIGRRCLASIGSGRGLKSSLTCSDLHSRAPQIYKSNVPDISSIVSSSHR